MRFSSFVRLIGSTGWKSRLLFHSPFSRRKLLNWNWSDQRLVTGLASCLLSSLVDASGESRTVAADPFIDSKVRPPGRPVPFRGIRPGPRAGRTAESQTGATHDQKRPGDAR